MNRNRGNAGFTLVELMVAILCGTIVTAAAITIMLLGLRINRSAVDTASDQYDARIVLSVLEDMATEGTIAGANTTGTGWELLDSSNKVIFSFVESDAAIYQGGGEGANKTVLIDGILSSSVILNPSGLLTFRIETRNGEYSSSVFCRTAVEGKNVEIEDLVTQDTIMPNPESSQEPTEAEERLAFLKILIDQYGSDGRIKVNGKYPDEDTYFSEWYNPNWGKGTAWCACFVSWGLDQVKGYVNGGLPKFAFVPDGVKGFINGTVNIGGVVQNWEKGWRPAGYTPIPGDIIFFQFDEDIYADHVGVVYYVDGNYIYTIEGNSGNRVAIRKYPTGSSYIYGYGVLNWNPNAITSSSTSN